jgi:hypothetical protein
MPPSSRKRARLSSLITMARNILRGWNTALILEVIHIERSPGTNPTTFLYYVSLLLFCYCSQCLAKLPSADPFYASELILFGVKFSYIGQRE